MVSFVLWSHFRGPGFSFFIYKSEFFWYRCFIQMLYCEGFSFYNVSWKGTAVLSCGTFSIWPILCSPATDYEMFMRHGGTCQNKCAYNSATNWYSMLLEAIFWGDLHKCVSSHAVTFSCVRNLFLAHVKFSVHCPWCLARVWLCEFQLQCELPQQEEYHDGTDTASQRGLSSLMWQ